MPSANYVEKVTERPVAALNLAKQVGVGEYAILSTREDGVLFRQALEKELDGLPPTGLLRIDFTDIKLMDASFADAALAVLALSMAKGAHKERYLLLEGLNAGSIQNLGYAIDSRQKREEKQVRNLVLSIQDNNGVETFGKLEEHLSKPLHYTRQEASVTARMLASKFNLDVAAASTKLKTLYDLRLLRREEIRDENGKQFMYRFFI